MDEHVAKKWKKNLYENQGLPDSYTDESFLDNLRKNIKPFNTTLLEAIALSASISVRISIIVLFLVIFYALHEDWTTPNVVFAYSSVFTVVGYFVYLSKVPFVYERLSKDLRTVVIYLAFGYILSPVLKTLTETISTNTIYSTTAFMFFTHLTFSRYGSPQFSLSDSLSVNSSIFGSLMLASRLATPLHAFTLLTVCVQCFVLLPFLLSSIRVDLGLSSILVAATVYSVSSFSGVMTILYIIATGFVHFVCPVCYVKWHKYKDNIYGPWDEAVISH